MSVVLNSNELKFKTFDLKNLKDKKLWSDLLKLTVSGWSATSFFYHLKNEPDSKYECNIRVAFYKKKPFAWSLVLKSFERSTPKIWLYTSPKFRKLGVQKIYLIPYWRRKYKDIAKDFIYQADHPCQKATFKYLKNKKQRLKQKPF